MTIHGSVGFADWPKTEVVGPSAHRAVELRYHHFLVHLELVPPGHLTNRLADADHPLLRRDRAKVRTSCFRRVATTKRVSQKIELFFRQSTDPRLRLVNCQLQLRHHVPHRGQRFFRAASTTDHEIVRIVDNVRPETPLVPEFLPSEYEPTHIQIA